jgi:GTP-binding protein
MRRATSGIAHPAQVTSPNHREPGEHVKVHAKFLTAAMDPAHFPPPSIPEIAFLGRSNVGKSSLLNSLAGDKIARTSSTPGRTRAINFFEVRRPGQPRPEWIFADLPGYGYAKLPKEVTAEWPNFIEPYLQNRESLVLCVALVDSRIPAQESDKHLVKWLRETGRHSIVVATKADKLSGNELPVALRRLQADLGLEKLVPYSAKTGAGKEDLWSIIRKAVELRAQRA